MPSPRLLPPQFLLPSWRARQLLERRQYSGARTDPPNRSGAQHSTAVSPKEPKLGRKVAFQGRESHRLNEKFAKELAQTRRAEEQFQEKFEGEPAQKSFFEDKFEKEPTKKSLFEELFPEAIQPKVEPEAAELYPALVMPTSEQKEEPRVYREPAILILSRASGTLVESDFYRASPQGIHIEGWATGITKSK